MSCKHHGKCHEKHEKHNKNESIECHKEEKKFIYVKKDIQDETVWTNDKIWIISAEVHVKCGAILYIQPNTTVWFDSYKLRSGCIQDGFQFATLIVDAGASIVAKRVTFKSDVQNTTGGLVIVGTLCDGTLPGHCSIKSCTTIKNGHSKLDRITFINLGNIDDCINSFTLFNVKGQGDCTTKRPEIKLGRISIVGSASNGMVIYGGNQKIVELSIYNSKLVDLALLWKAKLDIIEKLELVQCSGCFGCDSSLIQLVDDVCANINTLQVEKCARLILIGGKFAGLTGTYTSTGSFPSVGNVNDPVCIDVLAVDCTIITGTKTC